MNTHLSLRLNIYNITDETYIRNVNNNGGRYNPGNPRSAMLTSHVRSSEVAGMLLQIPDVLTAEQVAHARRLLDAADWVDGRVTAGHQSARVKDNLQLPEDHPVARELGDMILAALQRNALFISAALPLRVFPPLFNRYGAASRSATTSTTRSARSPAPAHSHPHRSVGDAVPRRAGRVRRRRADGRGHLRRPLGQAAGRPHGALSRRPACTTCTPVTRGARIASFFWIQSMVRDDGERTLLFDLDTAIQRLSVDVPDHPAVVQLTAVYHNLLRRWAEV